MAENCYITDVFLTATASREFCYMAICSAQSRNDSQILEWGKQMLAQPRIFVYVFSKYHGLLYSQQRLRIQINTLCRLRPI